MEPYSGDTAVIAKVGTTPEDRGLETEQFKAKFDEGLTAFVQWFNTEHKTEFETHVAGDTSDDVHGLSEILGQIKNRLNWKKVPNASVNIGDNKSLTVSEPFTEVMFMGSINNYVVYYSEVQLAEPSETMGRDSTSPSGLTLRTACQITSGWIYAHCKPDSSEGITAIFYR